MKNKQYPMTLLNLSKKVTSLVRNNKKPNYFLNFELIDTVNKSKGEVQDKKELISCKCKKHNYNFVAPARAFTNTSSSYRKVTCPYCMRDAKEIDFQTWEEIVLWIKNSSWPFEVADENQFNNNIIFNSRLGGLPTKTKITVRCIKNRIDSDVLCGRIKDHSYENIKFSINTKNDHLLCQGACDLKKKGKASRKTLPELQEQLKEARDATWKFDPNYHFIKASGKNLFIHQCGNSIKQNFYKLIKFPIENDLPNDTIQDCPFCSRRTAFYKVDNDVNKYAKSINTISKGNIALISKTMPSSPEKLALECQLCNTRFMGSEYKIKKYVHHGCPQCLNVKRHSQRAWVYEEAEQLVRKRGYELLSDPGDYISKTKMCTPEGYIIDSLDILSLLKQFPGSTIVHGTHESVNTLQNAGEPYSQEEDKLRKLLEQKRHTYKEIALLMNRTAGSIKTKTRRLNLRNDDRINSNRRFNLNDNAFQTLNKESAFYAGLFAADGCIDKRKNRKSLSIEIKAVDEDLLIGLMKFIGLKNKLKYRTMKNVDGRGVYASISFTSKQIVCDLKKYFNVDENKTYKLSPLTFDNDEVTWGFIAGLIAGDGHVDVSDKRNEPKINFVSASCECANWLKLIFKKEVGSVNIEKRRQNNAIHYYITVTGKKAIKIAKILQDYNFGMDRKWRVIRQITLMKIK